MAKRSKRKPAREEDDSGSFGSDGIKQSIVAIIMIAIGAIMLLAVFGLAGGAGDWADGKLAAFLGLSRVVVPVIMMLMGASMVMSENKLVSIKGLLSVALLVIGLNGLLNLIFAPNTVDPVETSTAGGTVGLLISQTLVVALGFAGALIIALALVLVAFILIFNISVQTILSLPKRMFGQGGSDDAQDEEEGAEVQESEADIGDTEASTEDGDDDSKTKKSRAAWFGSKKDEEQVMTTTARRKIEVPLDLLDNKRSEGKAGDINRNQEIIARTLEQFGINVEMSEVRVGPTVAQYSFRPAQGVKLSRVVALQNDLALALAAHPIRIEAPIPGKALVGVEVPNITVARVGLREGMESKEFNARKSDFSVPLGKDISGGTPILQVDKAPHMLVAGATGSGKSVCLNGIIISLLYQNGPDEMKFIMVDPKRVELGVYAGIPHLLVPPITKAEEAVNALKWAVREMERRLDHLSKFGARDIDAYNAKSKERMPRIIIVIDELADLMIQNKREVEAVIVRIAQMARAVGIHLVLATQRPSVDVITGTIKANIPTRLAFAVASQVDSKTIIDTAGADKLLGRGDMLMSTPELSKPRRVQGAYVSDAEITKVVDFLKKDNAPDYNYQITEGTSGSSGGTSFNADDADPLLEDAIQIALESGRVSTSFLQRRMKIGYSRAARIVDLMEELGVVGGADGAKPREVLVSEWPPAGSEPEEEVEEEVADEVEIEEEDEPVEEEVAEASEEEVDEDEMDEIMEEADPDKDKT